jgi:thymidylate synthase (FAD)
MEVKLLAHTSAASEVYDRLDAWHRDVESSDELAEYTGRLCYQSWDKPNPATATNDGYLANILKQRHESVLEHASATFLVEGVSRHLLGELTRHRHTSPSVESLRFCLPRTYAVHPTLAEYDLEHELAAQWEESLARYNRVYFSLIDEGLKRKEAAEAAAQFLPLATSTDLALTGNMRAWRELLKKRLDKAANREIRVLAEKILSILKVIAPHSFQDFEEN